MLGVSALYLVPFLLFVGNGVSATTPGSLHPLDSLTESEVTATVNIFKRYKQAGDWIFVYIVLKEPEKAVLLPHFLRNEDPPSQIPRRSFTIVLDRTTEVAYEVVINLGTSQVESFDPVPSGVHPSVTSDEMMEAEQIVRKNVTVQERCKQQGWDNMSLVNGDPWTIVSFESSGRRLVQCFLYGKNSEDDNQYAHPFDFVPIVDLLKRQVVRIDELPSHEDFDGNKKEGTVVPKAESNYDPVMRPGIPYRNDVKPVKVTQKGTSFSFVNNELTWQKFKMRLGFNGREGLVVYHVSYNDGGNVRPLFYRMALSEMFSSYGDPRTPYYKKQIFDEGQYGLGFCANELKPQMDCVGEVVFLDAILHNSTGHIFKIPKAVCINEEDAGILWKHSDYRNGKGTLTRSQRLALTVVITVGNYEYEFIWHFYQDASISFTVKLTGILNTHVMAEKTTPGAHGSTVSPAINGQFHQHLLTLRVDPEIDGNQNTVQVVDVVPGPGATGSAENPFGNAFTTKKTVLATAADSRTNIAPEKSRTWHITNTNHLHPFANQPVAWRLMTTPTPPLMLQHDSPIRKFAGHLEYHTWVTPYREDQMFAAGYYINSNGGGLPEWVRKEPGANIENTDIVLWHNFGLSHIPRVEDYPVMPTEQSTIFLKPCNFFTENPAMDVPEPKVKTEL